MNTIGSVYYGWGFLIACGAGSYYFAKRSINAERYERQAAQNELRTRQQRQLAGATHPTAGPVSSQIPRRGGTDGPGRGTNSGASTTDHSFNPSKEASADPAPADQPPGSAHVPDEGSKFESSRPFRSKKGDRFS